MSIEHPDPGAQEPKPLGRDAYSGTEGAFVGETGGVHGAGVGAGARSGSSAPAPHPSRQSLARALSGTAGADEVRLELLVHLIACCPECRTTVESLAELAHEYGHWDIAEALTEWREAPLLWRRLAPLSFADQLAAIDTDEDFWTWGVCRFLQLRSADQLAAQPAAAANLAALALRVTRNLGESYDVAWVRGLRALCLASLANARRQLGEVHAAADAIAAARRLLDAGTGNEVFEAEVLLVAGLVARDGRRLREALTCFEEAQALLAPAGPAGEAADQELLAAALAHQGWCLYHLGEVADALSCLAAAARHNDPARDPALAWGILLGQLWGALSLGRLDQARHLLELAREAAAGELLEVPVAIGPGAGGAAGAEHDDSSAVPAAAPPSVSCPVLGRAVARIARAAGQRAAAESQLRDAFAELLAAGRGVEAALAFLDLAALLLDTGASRDLSEAAVELIGDLLSRETDLQGADGAALIRLQHACVANHLASDPGLARVVPETPAAPGAAAPDPFGVPAGAPPAPPTARVTPTLLLQIGAGIERRRRPDLTWWSAAPPLAGGEEPSDGDPGL